MRCKGKDNFCCVTWISPCGEGDGDCDIDSDCDQTEGNKLVCGNNNCRYKSGDQWDSTDDCCYNPSNFIIL